MGAGPLLQLVRLVLTTQGTEVDDEVAGRVQGMGVVIAEHPATTGKGVSLELAGLFVVALLVQVNGKVAGRGEGAGVILAEPRRFRVRVSCWSWRAWLVLAQLAQALGEIAMI